MSSSTTFLFRPWRMGKVLWIFSRSKSFIGRCLSSHPGKDTIIPPPWSPREGRAWRPIRAASSAMRQKLIELSLASLRKQSFNLQQTLNLFREKLLRPRGGRKRIVNNLQCPQARSSGKRTRNLSAHRALVELLDHHLVVSRLSRGPLIIIYAVSVNNSSQRLGMP
jgi:hypothetical protein